MMVSYVQVLWASEKKGILHGNQLVFGGFAKFLQDFLWLASTPRHPVGSLRLSCHWSELPFLFWGGGADGTL